jgi:predicted nucleotidyltransferase
MFVSCGGLAALSMRPDRDGKHSPVDARPIEVLLERMIIELRPVEIRLFGSRARGDASAASDWDLFVVVPDDLEVADDLFVGYRLRRETRTRADIILCPLSEFIEDRETPNPLAYEAANHAWNEIGFERGRFTRHRSRAHAQPSTLRTGTALHPLRFV